MAVTASISEFFDEIPGILPDWTPSVIFDVGANVGQSAIGYATAFPNSSVHSFEPVPASYTRLSSVTARFPNVTTHLVALGKTTGKVNMTGRGTQTGNHIVRTPEKVSDIIEVEIDTGASFAIKQGVDKISYLKVDTEGHDYNVLVGFLPIIQNIEFIQVETSMNSYNKRHVPFRMVEDLLRNEGFCLFKFYDQTLEFGGGGRPILRRANPVFINGARFNLTGL